MTSLPVNHVLMRDHCDECESTSLRISGPSVTRTSGCEKGLTFAPPLPLTALKTAYYHGLRVLHRLN